ncbi:MULTISPECIES: zinc-binding protein [Clostridium]|uniref:zinc-binding protein n=1 Tax=Clostridium TaxID=1485 RepID=UPI000BE417CC|nr:MULTISPECIES: zinc-binding protein [Clostridium]MBS4958331.1 zinc-binding protein [Clostridium sp.]
MDVKKEYERIKSLFDGVDEQQLNLIDGALWECARLRVELNDLHEIVISSGLIKVHPKNSTLQKELPVSKLIVKTRANYLNYISKLSNLLGKNITDEDDDLGDYE